MSGTSSDSTPKTRPEQLMPEGENAVKALQSLMYILGMNPGAVNGSFTPETKGAYDQARAKYSFLPDIGATPDQEALEQVFRAVDQNLQTNVSFQQDYLRGLAAEDDVVQLQGALVAGGSWANRHLGDRISNAEAVNIDGDRGKLTNRAVRNAATLTGVATLQASLNLLIGTNLQPNGMMTDDTKTAMQTYAGQNGLTLTDDVQQNFALVVQHIDENKGDALRARVSEVLRTDTDLRAPDARTLDAQIVMNGIALDRGLDVRTAPDGRQTDNRITAELSHTRTVIAPATGVSLTAPAPVAEAAPAAPAPAEPAPEVGPPFGLNEMYRVTRNDVLQEVQSIADRQTGSSGSPQNILAYSEEARGFLLISRAEGASSSTVYQISDRNVSRIMSGINDGSIAMDVSARKFIAEKVHGDTPETRAYGAEELRAAFSEKPTRYTSDTREGLLTTSAVMPDGATVTFGLDDFHDGLGRMDSKRDWPDAADAVATRDYVRALRDAVKDAREERPFGLPQWTGGALDDSNSVEINVAGQTARVPADIWRGVTEKMAQTQGGFSVGRDESSVIRTAASAQSAEPGSELSTGFREAGTSGEDLVAENAADIDVEGDDRVVEPGAAAPAAAPAAPPARVQV